MSEGGLFEMEPTGVHVGDLVIVQTIFGDEVGTVSACGVDAGYPVVTVVTEQDTITIGVSRVRRA